MLPDAIELVGESVEDSGDLGDVVGNITAFVELVVPGPNRSLGDSIEPSERQRTDPVFDAEFPALMFKPGYELGSAANLHSFNLERNLANDRIAEVEWVAGGSLHVCFGGNSFRQTI